MFGSTILDVAIGVVLAFLGISLAASAVTEAISSAMKWRETTLLAGIKAMVNDPDCAGIALQLYNHALINPLASGAAAAAKQLTHKPAYIDSKQFALAFYDVIARGQASPADSIEAIADPQLKVAVGTLWRSAEGDIQNFKVHLGVWFDNSMDRLSGWYKQRTQWVSFLAAFAIAGIMNMNVIYEGTQIWSHPSLIANTQSGGLEKVVDAASKCSPKEPLQSAAPAKPNAPSDIGPEGANCKVFKDILGQLESAELFGWGVGPAPTGGFPSWPWTRAILSWLIVAGSTLFGASFWFDTLQRLTQLRGTGLVPNKVNGEKAKPDFAI